NADEHNNIFQPVVRNLATYEFWIFNRWGEVIFHSTNPNEGWNGTFKNVMCLNDVYVWKIEYSDYIEPDIYKVKMGHVTLVK
ncbi:MAG: gliding motility-associated C-terminal domain-containing protein, partial [Flavobacteriales bacterium]|nr:gliding motility-associated C-terminal domain-containing protein [Flavobacteriales bacterium]